MRVQRAEGHNLRRFCMENKGGVDQEPVKRKRKISIALAPGQPSIQSTQRTQCTVKQLPEAGNLVDFQYRP